jgi:hypothetical protein
MVSPAVLLSNLNVAKRKLPPGQPRGHDGITPGMIRKLKSGQYRLYSRKRDASGKRRNLGTFSSLRAATQHEREVQYFKRHQGG